MISKQYVHFSLSAKFKRVFVCAIAMMAIGCTYPHTVAKTDRALQMLDLKSELHLERNQRWVLAANSAVLVNYPSGPLGAPQALPRLRFALAEPWLQQVQWRFAHVAMAPMDASQEELFQLARAGQFGFVLRLSAVQTLGDTDLPAAVDATGAGSLPSGNSGLHGERLVLVLEVFDTHTEARLDTLAVARERAFWDWSARVDKPLLMASLATLLAPLSGASISQVY